MKNIFYYILIIILFGCNNSSNDDNCAVVIDCNADNMTFNFQGTNKADDSYYKLGLCYINLNDEVRALDSFNKLHKDV